MELEEIGKAIRLQEDIGSNKMLLECNFYWSSFPEFQMAFNSVNEKAKNTAETTPESTSKSRFSILVLFFWIQVHQ